ncbi:MAG TPA: HEAT repeat domain-containing protein, partial [Candidatus Xenobia bacterium]
GSLARLSAEKPQVIDECLKRAHEAYFIRPATGEWLFVSEATREACYHRLSPSHRRQLHLAIGRLEEETAAVSPTVSYHYEQAGALARSLEQVSRELLSPTTVEIVLRDKLDPKDWAHAAHLTDDQLDRFKQAMAYLTRAVKSTSSYGAHSPIAHTSIDMGYAVLAGLLREVGPLVITCSESYYAVNNRELVPGDAPGDLAHIFRRHKTNGCEIRPELDLGQLTKFLDLLAGPHDTVTREGGWGTALANRAVTAVQMIANVLVEVSERALFDPARPRPPTPAPVKDEGSLDAPLASFIEQRPELLIRHLESTQREDRVLAATGLLQHGPRARPLLLRYLAESDDVQGRAAALFLLSHMLPDVGGHLIHRLVEATTEAEALRLLRAMQEGGLAWERPLQVLLHSSSSAIRRGVGRMLVETPLLASREKVEALREVLKTDHPPVVLDALMAVSDLNHPEMVPDVNRILDRTWAKGSPDVLRAQVQACYTLGRIGSVSSAVPILRDLLHQGRAAEVRAAATWAVGLLPCDETRELLVHLTCDSDPAVRGAARLALDTPPPDGPLRPLARQAIEEGLP